MPTERSVFGPEGMIKRVEEPKPKGKVSPARYAQLVANAAVFGMDECWIAKHPVLLVGEYFCSCSCGIDRGAVSQCRRAAPSV